MLKQPEITIGRYSGHAHCYAQVTNIVVFAQRLKSHHRDNLAAPSIPSARETAHPRAQLEERLLLAVSMVSRLQGHRARCLSHEWRRARSHMVCNAGNTRTLNQQLSHVRHRQDEGKATVHGALHAPSSQASKVIGMLAPLPRHLGVPISWRWMST